MKLSNELIELQESFLSYGKRMGYTEESYQDYLKKVNEFFEWKFENKHVKQRLLKLIGSSSYKKCLYCWSWNQETREFAKKIGITPVSFSEIIDYLLMKVDKREGWLYLKDFPNLMLLQFLQTEGYLNPQ